MKLIGLLATLVALPFAALAGVNPQNGNFYISYKDVSRERAGRELAITRTYNSRATNVGWFGYGWGSRFETRLYVLPDGSAAIKEIGSGRATYYRADNQADTNKGVERIVQFAAKRDGLSPEAAERLTARLLANEDLRLEHVIKYGLHSELKIGASLGDVCGKLALTRSREGYRRIDCNHFGDSEAAVDTFDLQGRLVRRELKDNYAVTIRYANSGAAEIRDTLGQSIALNWTKDGRVASAKAGDTLSQYSYENQDLVKNIQADGNYYRYSYDADHNLTRVTYVDDSSMVISYVPQSGGRVDSVTNTDGSKHTYAYRIDPANPKHYWTRRTSISSDGQTSTKEFEYEDQSSGTGSTQTSRTTVASGMTSVETRFDSKGRVVQKSDGKGGVMTFEYHPTSNKLSVLRKNNTITEFRYDGKGELIQASNSDGQLIDLEYSAAAEITRLVIANRPEQSRHELEFKYNEAGRPSEITLVGAGKIDLKYNEQGQISKVGSEQGPTVALRITQIFQSVLEVLSVAGAKF